MTLCGQTIRSHFDAQRDDMVRDIISWANINSGSFNLAGVTEMIAVLSGRFAAIGADVELVASKPSLQVTDAGEEIRQEWGPVLMARFRPECKRRILFTGHADTVFPPDSAFQECFIKDDNILRGPGVADMKGGIRIMLAAIDYILQHGLAADLGIDVAINADEETGSLGSSGYFEQIAPGYMAGLIVEPAMPDGTLAGARAGSANMAVAFTGRAAHAGREFFEGRNAVIAAAETGLKIAALSDKDKGITVNVASIDGGSATNVVPENAVLRLNVRARNQDALQETVGAIRTEIASTAEKHSVAARIYGDAHRPAKEWTPEMRQLFNTVRKVGTDLGIDISWKDTGGCCDGNNLAAAGLPVIDTMGVVGGNIHSDQEYALIDSFAERATLLTCLVDAIAGLEFNNAEGEG